MMYGLLFPLAVIVCACMSRLNPNRLTLLILLCALALLMLAPAPTRAQNPNPQPQPSRWDGQSRFTVLFLGMDRRPNARDTLSTRTDAILLLSFDPATNSIGMLHIPRDLHFAALDIETLLRVNTLMLRGNEIQEGYGPYYAMDTIQYNLGMYIDAYVAFDFEAFITLVDAVGGIEITTNYDIIDPTYPDMNYGFDPFYLRAGTHRMDGRTALKFARTRHGDNDYLRGIRQMEVVKAIGLRATEPGVLPGLIRRAPELLSSVERNVYTDLTLGEAVPLLLFAAQLSLDDVQTGSINQAYLTYAFQEGSSVAIPDRSKLPELMESVFGAGYGG